jgi:ParB/RepB/Spo0J family partition protein
MSTETAVVPTTPDAPPENAVPVKKVKEVVYKVDETKIVPLALALIKSNDQNPRESAAKLMEYGYGTFHAIEGAGKPALMDMAMSDDKKMRDEYVKLVNQFEVPLKDLAADIMVNKQIQPVWVRASKESKGHYDLVIGCRRVMACAYNHCAHGTPATVQAVVVELDDDGKAMYTSFSENRHRQDMSPMDEAKWFASMRQQGLKPAEIEKVTNVDHQTVRTRMDLLKLPQELQDKVHTGELGVAKAKKILEGKADAKDPVASRKGGRAPKPGATKNGSRDRAPNLAWFREVYQTDENIDEKVREWIAIQILQVPYLALKELKAAAAEAEAANSVKDKEGKNGQAAPAKGKKTGAKKKKK